MDDRETIAGELRSLGTGMRGLTLTQPWASLVELNEKKFETRGWQTKYRGWLAIQAAKGFPKYCREMCEEPLFYKALNPTHRTEPPDVNWWEKLPRGEITAVVKLTGITAAEYTKDYISEKERAFGNYGPNRFAWEFSRVIRLKEGIPFRGLQCLWRVPVSTVEQIIERLP